jgi:hypothetical protein
MSREGRLSLRRICALALCTAAAATTPGCGGSSSNPLGPRLENVVVFRHEATFNELARFAVFVSDFTVPEAGSLHITVDWTSSTNDIDLVLSNPACDAVALAAGLCKVLGTEESNKKPAELTLVTGPTSYRLIVVNRGPAVESGTVQATVTQSRVVP